MYVYRISKCKYINDLSGFGAANFPGRWNSKGTYMLYTAATASLALLENIVHISTIPTESYCIATIVLPEDKISNIDIAELPKGWNQYPAPEKLKHIGDDFIGKNEKLALRIPSAIMPEDFIFLINCRHPDFGKVEISAIREIEFDKRLVK